MGYKMAQEALERATIKVPCDWEGRFSDAAHKGNGGTKVKTVNGSSGSSSHLPTMGVGTNGISDLLRIWMEWKDLVLTFINEDFQHVQGYFEFKLSYNRDRTLLIWLFSFLTYRTCSCIGMTANLCDFQGSQSTFPFPFFSQPCWRAPVWRRKKWKVLWRKK